MGAQTGARNDATPARLTGHRLLLVAEAIVHQNSGEAGHAGCSAGDARHAAANRARSSCPPSRNSNAGDLVSRAVSITVCHAHMASLIVEERARSVERPNPFRPTVLCRLLLIRVDASRFTFGSREHDSVKLSALTARRCVDLLRPDSFRMGERTTGRASETNMKRDGKKRAESPVGVECQCAVRKARRNHIGAQEVRSGGLARVCGRDFL